YAQRTIEDFRPPAHESCVADHQRASRRGRLGSGPTGDHCGYLSVNERSHSVSLAYVARPAKPYSAPAARAGTGKSIRVGPPGEQTENLPAVASGRGLVCGAASASGTVGRGVGD